MNISDVLKTVDQASLFELYRLSVAIERELENPERLLSVKRELVVGKMVSYFCPRRQSDVVAVVTALNPKRLQAKEIKSGRHCSLPYYMLNLSGITTRIQDSSGNLTAQTLSVGEVVGFTDKYGKEKIGKIERLNVKSVSLFIEKTNERWRVAYSVLHRVYESELAMQGISGRTYEAE